MSPQTRAASRPGDAARVRPLVAGDLDAVVAIDAAASGRSRRTYFERRLAAALRAPKLHAQFGAERNGALVGFILGRVLEGEFGRIDPAMRLEVIGVAPTERGRGVGLALEQALEDQARRHGLKEMRTGAQWRAHAMLRFLDAAGFELGRNQVVDCALGGSRLGTSDEEPVTVPERDRPGDRHDYGAAAPNDFEKLARDLAEVRSIARSDLADMARIDRRLTGHDRSAYIEHKLEEALTESAIRLSLIARYEGTTAGFLTASADYGDFGRPEPVAVIDTIGVDPSFAHAGIGHALLSQLFINLRGLHIERVETVVDKEHFNLLGFFYRSGFSPSQWLAFGKRLAGAPPDPSPPPSESGSRGASAPPERTERRLSYVALVDPSTRLPNRALFLERLGDASAAALVSGRDMMLLLVSFRLTEAAANAAAAAEDLARQVSARLQHCLRETDMLARTGEAEFGILLGGVHAHERAAVPAGRVIAAFCDPVEIEGSLRRVEAWIGIAEAGGEGATPESALERARGALAEARRGGAGTIAFAPVREGAQAGPLALVEWAERYKVGVSVIDGQHRHLFELVNRLGAGLRAGRDLGELVEALKELVRYTEHHFATEERLMRETGAGSDRHRGEHRRLLESLTQFTVRLDAHAVEEGSRFLRDWLLHHIDEMDRPFAASLRKHGVA